MEWAAVHEVPAGEGDAFWVYGNEVPLAGEGVPGVGEYAVAEFAAATGMSTDAGRQFIGDALEVAWRLPKLWEHVQAGTVPVWRARMVAEQDPHPHPLRPPGSSTSMSPRWRGRSAPPSSNG